jgi:hypothetical protein
VREALTFFFPSSAIKIGLIPWTVAVSVAGEIGGFFLVVCVDFAVVIVFFLDLFKFLPFVVLYRWGTRKLIFPEKGRLFA